MNYPNKDEVITKLKLAIPNMKEGVYELIGKYLDMAFIEGKMKGGEEVIKFTQLPKDK